MQQRHTKRVRFKLSGQMIHGGLLAWIQNHRFTAQCQGLGNRRQRPNHPTRCDTDKTVANELLERDRPALSLTQKGFFFYPARFLKCLERLQNIENRTLLFAFDIGAGLPGFRGQIDKLLGLCPGIFFDRRRNNRGQNLPQRADIILGNPAGQRHQLAIQ